MVKNRSHIIRKAEFTIIEGTDESHLLRQVPLLGMEETQEINVYNLLYSEITVTKLSTKTRLGAC